MSIYFNLKKLLNICLGYLWVLGCHYVIDGGGGHYAMLHYDSFTM